MSPAKRARADTVGTADLHSAESIEKMLERLTPAMSLKILKVAAARHTDVMADIEAAHDRLLESEAAKAARDAVKVISFAPYSDKAWAKIDKTFNHKSSSKQYDAAMDAAMKIEHWLGEIAAATNPQSPFQTKFSAVDSICDIYDSAISCGEMTGRGLRQNFYNWGRHLISVLNTFTDEELCELGGMQVNTEDGAMGWMDKFEVTAKEAKSYCVQGPLKTVEALEIILAAGGGGRGGRGGD